MAINPAAAAPRGQRYKPNLKVIVPTFLVCVAFVVLVLLVDDLRREYWIQRLTAVVLTFAIAVMLFSVVPSTAYLQQSLPELPLLTSATAVRTLAALRGTAISLKGGIVIGGAALFFLYAVPRVIEAIFPPNVTVTGYTYHKPSGPPDAGLVPARGVVIQIPETGQKSEPTNADGRFVIDHVSFQPRTLDAHYGGVVYPIDVAKYPDSRYPIIPPLVAPIRSPLHPIPANAWVQELRPSCPPSAGTYRGVKQYVLSQTITKRAEDTTLHLRVLLQGEGQIIDAQDLDPGTSLDITEQERGRARQWEWDCSAYGSEIPIRVSVCLGTKKRGEIVSNVNLRVVYSFGKEAIQ